MIENSARKHRREDLRLALPKDRFSPHSMEILTKLQAKQSGGLLKCEIEGTKLVAYLLKSADIPRLVAGGIIDIGVAPDEWYIELIQSDLDSLEVFIERKISWIRTQLSFFSDGSFRWPPREGVVVATSFPNTTKSVLRNCGANASAILHLHGSVEAVVPELADLGFDCVETGNTLRAHGLQPIFSPYTELGLSLISNRYFRDFPDRKCTKLILDIFDREAKEEFRGL